MANISVKGTTKVRLYGFGFVNSTGTDLKTKFGTVARGELNCNSYNCTKMATYIDKNTIETPTF
jgi:predicted unusual protein kinase regulating ubiquinone biosynthesis (AarF/ABC1/UbiB family)